MTAKQRLFAEWYCSAAVNMNGTEAARRAGYKGNDNTLASVAAENMRKHAIRNEIDLRLEVATEGAAVTIKEILVQLQVIYARAVESRKYSAAIRCLELQGKYLGMWNGKMSQSPEIEEMSDQDLVDLLLEICGNNGIDLESFTGGRLDVRHCFTGSETEGRGSKR